MRDVFTKLSLLWKWWSFLSPIQRALLSFLIPILIGTFLLKLPYATKSGIRLIDALFTATSATCVTGLIVLDTGTDFTFFGQIVILILIQLGGLGLMTLSAYFIVLFGRRLSFEQWHTLRSTFSAEERISVPRMLRNILLIAFFFEGLGTLILYFHWKSKLPKIYPDKDVLFASIFHAISAFCNAGFSIFSENLARFQGDVLVNFTIAGLFIIGGLGFYVIIELFQKIRYEGRSIFTRGRFFQILSLHTKLVITTTGILIFSGTFLLLILEWTNTLQHLSTFQKIVAAFFQAVTPRTAGFNTVDIGNMSSSALLIIMVLMFVGASPGSTGGGIKTTTLSILYTAAISELQNRDDVYIFNRRIPKPTIRRAITVTLLSIVVVACATAWLLFFETGLKPYKNAGSAYLSLLFETISAFGTVGLSTGITPNLHTWSKFVLCFVMFFGRVGPLTIGYAILERQRQPSIIDMPDESPLLG